jgi:hypothetical protein
MLDYFVFYIGIILWLRMNVLVALIILYYQWFGFAWLKFYVCRLFAYKCIFCFTIFPLSAIWVKQDLLDTQINSISIEVL